MSYKVKTSLFICRQSAAISPVNLQNPDKGGNDYRRWSQLMLYVAVSVRSLCRVPYNARCILLHDLGVQCAGWATKNKSWHLYDDHVGFWSTQLSSHFLYESYSYVWRRLDQKLYALFCLLLLFNITQSRSKAFSMFIYSQAVELITNRTGAHFFRNKKMESRNKSPQNICEFNHADFQFLLKACNSKRTCTVR